MLNSASQFHTIVVSATYIIEYGYKFDNKLLFIYLLHWKLPCSIYFHGNGWVDHVHELFYTNYFNDYSNSLLKQKGESLSQTYKGFIRRFFLISAVFHLADLSLIMMHILRPSWIPIFGIYRKEIVKIGWD